MHVYFLLLIVTSLVPSAMAQSKMSVAVDIKADRVEIDQKKGRVEFTGSVRVTRGSLVMQCERLVARYRKEGSLTQLTITGRLTVRGREFTAQAGQGRYDHQKARLVLTGKPKVQRGPHSMVGDRIVVFIDEERVVVERARGRVALPDRNMQTK